MQKEQRTFYKAYHDVMSTPCKGKITQNLKLVYCLLASFTESTGNAFPSNQYIADALGISKRAVIDNTAELERLGLIHKQRQFNNSNIYTVRPWVIEARGAAVAPGGEVSSPGGATSSPPEVQPTALYKNSNNTIDNTKDKTEESTQESEVVNDSSLPCIPFPSVSRVSSGGDKYAISPDKQAQADTAAEQRRYAREYGAPF